MVVGKPGVGEKIVHRVEKIEHQFGPPQAENFGNLQRSVTISECPRHPQDAKFRPPAAGTPPPPLIPLQLHQQCNVVSKASCQTDHTFCLKKRSRGEGEDCCHTSDDKLDL